MIRDEYVQVLEVIFTDKTRKWEKLKRKDWTEFWFMHLRCRLSDGDEVYISRYCSLDRLDESNKLQSYIDQMKYKHKLKIKFRQHWPWYDFISIDFTPEESNK